MHTSSFQLGHKRKPLMQTTAAQRRAYRKAQEIHTRNLPPLDAEIWGMWHEHTCCDCHVVYACQAAHGKKLESTSKVRCDSCFEKRMFS